MKVPSREKVQSFNRQARATSRRTYLRVLRGALVQYSRLTGDTRLLGLFRARDWPTFFREVDALVVQKYTTAEMHFAAHQLAALVRKYPWDPKLIGTDPEAAARETFIQTEKRCGLMNRKFVALRRCYRPSPARNDLRELLERMRQWIRYVIGDAPNLPSIYSKCDLTAGANVGVTGDATNLGRKLTARWSVTPTALPYLAAAMCHNVHFATKVAKSNGVVQSYYVSYEDVKEHCELVHSNKIAFVLKTAKTFRSIASEPLGNGLLQKGTDLEMRLFLLRVGIDLRDQTLNQRLAREGSLDDGPEGFVTMDERNASDSNCVELCSEVLPRDWFLFLNRIRSASYRLDGVEHRSNKFCTMGNGFCFPLETLIFAAVCHACGCGKAGVDWAVYGDDIIVRKKFCARVGSALKSIGFSPNVKKTLVEGPYRESCGSNWYRGEDVTPMTLDYALDNLSAFFKFANLARRNERTSSFLSRAIASVIEALPEDLRFFRPFKGAADTGIDPWEVQYTKRFWSMNRQVQSPKWLELETRPMKDELRYPGWVVMAAALRGASSESPFTYRRKTVTRVRVISRPCDLDRVVQLPWMIDPGKLTRRRYAQA